MTARTITLSALGPTIAEQLQAMGLEQVGKDVETLDRIGHAITLIYLHGCLTDAETNRARKRLVKQLRLRPQSPGSTEPVE